MATPINSASNFNGFSQSVPGDGAPKNVVPTVPSPSVIGNSKIAGDVDFRLVIEHDAKTGGFIYKTLNRLTGEVVSQHPREDLVLLRDSHSYSPGKVVDSKA